jgi:4-amino-4-deoxy-L-arabinose transferase-like glycosyltransferase
MSSLNKPSTFLLLLVMGIAAVLRLYAIGVNPPSLNWDEVSIGYNAYSVLKTGYDEHKRFLPLDTFIAYGDYKPPVAVYLTVPFIAVLGLTESAVRLPSAISGILAVVLSFAVCLRLFDAKAGRNAVALLAAFLLAVSPWHITLSRAGFEANIALTLMLLGVYLILSTTRRPSLLGYCWLPFVAAFYTFNSSRYFLPILAIMLCWYIRNTIWQNRKIALFGLVLAMCLMLPILPHLFSKNARLRFVEVNIFNDYPLIYTANSRVAYDGYNIFGKAFHNFRLVYARSYLMHYFDHFQPWFLFIRGDGNPKFSIQDTGQLYLMEAPFLLVGLYAVWRYASKQALVLSVWLLGAIIPAAVARETPHALRIENSLPVWQVFTAAGIVYALNSLKRYRTYFLVLIGFSYVFWVGYFLHNYFLHYPREFSGEWQYGYREAIRYAETVKGRYDTIVVSDSIGRPYMYTLFYGRYEPEYFWKTRNSGFDAAGFYNVKGFGKYRFTDVGTGSYPGRVLYVMPPKLVPPGANILETVRLLNGNPVLLIFDSV